MGLFDTVRAMSIARVAGRKAADVAWDGDRGWSLVRGKDGDETPRRFQDYVRDGFRRNPVVRRCVEVWQQAFAEAPVRAYRRDGDGNYERIVGHPAEEMFVQANPRDPGVQLVEKAVQHFLLGGNWFWEKRRSGLGVPIELYPIRPDYVVGVDVDRRGMPVRWEVVDDPQYNTKRWVRARDLVHVPDSDPMNDIFGMPRLAAAALETDTDNKASEYVSEVLSNFGSPGTLVMLDAEKVRQASAIERAEARWTEKFGPGRGRGKVAFLPGATRVENIGFNLQQLEFKDLRHVTREGMAAVFGVNPALIGLGTAAKGGTLSGNEFREMREALWEQTILPAMRRAEAFLNAHLAPEWGENVWLKFDTSEVQALQPDRDADVERAGKMAEAGAFTMPEIRSEAGMDPDVDDDAIVVLKGQGLKHVLFEDLVTDPEEEAQRLADQLAGDGEEEPEPEDDDEEAAAHVALLTKSLDVWTADAGPVKRVPHGVPFTALGDGVPGRSDKAARADAWKRFDAFARAQETAYRLAAEELYAVQAEELRRLAWVSMRDAEGAASVHPTLDRKGITPESLDEFRRRLGDKFTEYHRAWRRRYDDLMSQTVDVVAGRLAGATGLSFNVFNPLVRRAIDERLNLIVGADELTFRGVMHVVEEGFVQGLSRNQMADRIAAVVTDGVTMRLPSGKTRILGAAERAKLIATTETTAVSNKAATALLRTTDIPWVKMWLTQGDDRVRPEHTEEEADSEAEPVPLEEAFRVTGLTEPAEPNCRCTLLFEQP